MCPSPWADAASHQEAQFDESSGAGEGFQTHLPPWPGTFGQCRTCTTVHGNPAQAGQTPIHLRSSNRTRQLEAVTILPWLRKMADSESPPDLGLTGLGHKPTLDNYFSSFQAVHRMLQHLALSNLPSQALCPLQFFASHFLQEASLVP